MEVPSDRPSEESSSTPTESSSEKKQEYPKAVFFIVGNEFCERFNYYGLRTVLTIYLTQRLYYSDSQATVIYHLFALIAYFTPVLGAIIADSWLGKFRTILYLSILYAIGGIVLSFGAFPNEISTMRLVTLIGLIVIGFGTGGIKPCVSAFGGDQFKPGQEKFQKQFFSLFYLSINAGSLLSTFLTPILREDVHCLGENSCFPVAFGVPAALMVVAVVLFIVGKPWYVCKPPEGNIALKVTKCVCYAIGKRCKSSEKKREHWLDYADDKFDKTLIEEIKILFHVFVLFIPLPLFWALFDQQGSRWTLQATRMDGKLGAYHIKADQMQVINPFLIIMFIPLFEYVVYPLFAKMNFLKTSLQRITTGGILAAISFTIAGLIELSLERNYPTLPSSGHSQLTIINNSPCPVKLDGPNIPGIAAFDTSVLELPLEAQHSWTLTPQNCSTYAEASTFTFTTNSSIESMMITLENRKLTALKTNDTKTKAKDGSPQVRIFYNIDVPRNSNVSFLLYETEKDSKEFVYTYSQEEYGISDYLQVPPGKYQVFVPYNQTAYGKIPVVEETFKSGGIYIVYIYNKDGENRKDSTVYEMVKGNEISILLQIPQYAIITAGEIMFSITGLEFSYSQSPTSMKSVIQAVWLLTVAFGNLIVLVIARLKLFDKISYELFLFAVLMGIDMVVFGILAYFYKYVTFKNTNNEEGDVQPSKGNSESNGKSNEGYVEETDFNK